MNRPSHTKKLICVALLCIAVSLCGYWWISGQRFDSALWKSVTESDATRLAMVDDLLERYELVGMTREEIDRLLGVPPETGYFANFEYVYWLGPERGFISIDSEWLCIDFEDGVVSDVRLMRD